MRIFLLLIFFTNYLFAQTIPADRLTDWSHAGYTGIIPSPSTILDVTNFGGVGDSITDNTTAINNAIDSLHGTRGVIYFPPGNFLINSSIDLPDSVIIRGASSDSTHLIFDLGGTVQNCFNISGSVGSIFVNATTPPLKGNNYILVDSISIFNAGDYVELLENNGAWDTQPVFWADNSVGQILKITSISADTIFFDSNLRISYDSALNPRARKIIPATEIGVECLHMLRADTNSLGVCYNIFLNYAANCWLRGVHSSMSIGSHVEMDACTHISIAGCYFHHSFLYDGVSTHGYGITLFSHSGDCLIENNIMRFLRHSFSLQTGANGNVIAYNYSIEPNRSEFPSNAGADISLHGHYPYMNLFEGNIVQNIQIDVTHGPNGPFNTFFRNRAELYGLVMSSATVQTDSQTFVGNEIPNTQILMGNYTLTGTGHFEFANNVRGTITPAGATSLPDISYYLSSPPPYWNIMAYPSIGMPNVLWSGSLPAKERYLSGVYLTMCEDTILINTVNEITNPDFEVYPNPSNAEIHIRCSAIGKIQLIDLTGRILSEKNISSNETVLYPPNDFEDGIYFVKFYSGERTYSKKLMLIR